MAAPVGGPLLCQAGHLYPRLFTKNPGKRILLESSVLCHQCFDRVSGDAQNITAVFFVFFFLSFNLHVKKLKLWS